MSAPNRGYLKAEIYGLPFTFDGEVWTYPEIPPESKEFFDLFVDDLNSWMGRQGITYHTPLRTRAKMMLKCAVPHEEGVGWRIVEEIPSKAWDKPLPPGTID